MCVSIGLALGWWCLSCILHNVPYSFLQAPQVSTVKLLYHFLCLVVYGLRHTWKDRSTGSYSETPLP